MYESLLDNGLTKVNTWLDEMDAFKKSLEFILSVNYIYFPINKICFSMFNDEFKNLIKESVFDNAINKYNSSYDDLVILTAIENATEENNMKPKEIKEDREIHNKVLNKMTENFDKLYYQSLEIIYNLFKWFSLTKKYSEMNTYKLLEIPKLLKKIEQKLSLLNYEFIETKIQEKEINLTYNEEEKIKVNCFFKMVFKISKLKKDIIRKPRYINLYEEFITKKTNIKRKSDILNNISEIVDGKAKKVKEIFGNSISNKLFEFLNNLNIRHDNENINSKYFNKNFSSISEEELKNKYNWIMKIILAFWVIEDS